MAFFVWRMALEHKLSKINKFNIPNNTTTLNTNLISEQIINETNEDLSAKKQSNNKKSRPVIKKDTKNSSLGLRFSERKEEDI
jgi:hypothetical protein